MIDPGKSLSYNITIQCSLDGFCFVIHDIEENKIIDIELYQTSETGDETLIMETLEKTVFKKGLYEKPVHSVRYIVDNRLNTLIPEELFDEEQMESYFRFNHDLPQGYSLLSESYRCSTASTYLPFRIYKKKPSSACGATSPLHTNQVYS